MKCSECDLDFLNGKILSLHMKLMHEENLTSNQPVKNFTNYHSCEKCDKIFSEMSSYLKHQYEEHGQNEASKPVERIDPVDNHKIVKESDPIENDVTQVST